MIFPINLVISILKEENRLKQIISFEGCLRLEVHQTCIYSKKINILMSKLQETCIYSKKSKNDREKSPNLHILKTIKHFDSEKSPNLHILTKIKQIKNFRLYVGLTGIDELVLDFLIFLSICRFDFSLSFFVFFEHMQVLCTFGIKMLFFFEYMQVW